MKPYTPLKGFFDLRDFNIPKKDFVKFYNVQKFLYRCEQARRKGLYEHRQGELRKIIELSAEYQQILFKYEERTGENGN